MNEKIILAKQIAKKAFADKKDLAGESYIHHLERVVANIAQNLNNDNILSAAWLHDLLEDCPEWSEYDLRDLFDHEIVEIVVLLTKKEEQDYFEYIESLKNNIAALEIKKADLFDNMNLSRLPEINETDVDRLHKYQKAYKMVETFIEEFHSKK